MRGQIHKNIYIFQSNNMKSFRLDKYIPMHNCIFDTNKFPLICILWDIISGQNILKYISGKHFCLTFYGLGG